MVFFKITASVSSSKNPILFLFKSNSKVNIAYLSSKTFLLKKGPTFISNFTKKICTNLTLSFF